ncbi:hypothetical protein GW932_01085 [archaeon]|nr:hypothetical protein [archaeon]
MVKTETKHYCDICGEGFDNLKRAKIHELRPKKISNEYQGLFFQNYGRTYLVLVNEKEFDYKHQNMYLVFFTYSHNLDKVDDFQFTSEVYELDRLQSWLKENSFEQDLDLGKTFWNRIKEVYKKIPRGENKKLVESIGELELKTLKK